MSKEVTLKTVGRLGNGNAMVTVNVQKGTEFKHVWNSFFVEVTLKYFLRYGHVIMVILDVYQLKKNILIVKKNFLNVIYCTVFPVLVRNQDRRDLA